MSTADLIATARAALAAESPDAASAVLACQETSPLAAATVLLEVGSGRLGVTQAARERACDLAADLVDQATFHEALVMIIRPTVVGGVRVKAPCNAETLFRVFGLAWVSDVDLIAAGDKDGSARTFAHLRFANVTPRPERFLAGGEIEGPRADAILESIYAYLDRTDWARLGVACETYTECADPDLVEFKFWVWGTQAVGFLSAYGEPVGHDAEPVFYYSKEDSSPEVPLRSARPRAEGRELSLPFSHPPGRYRVHAFLADRPVSREQMQGARGSANILATASAEFTVDPVPEGPAEPPMELSEQEAKDGFERVMALLEARKKAEADD